MDEYRPSGEPVRFATGGAFSSDNATVPRHFHWLRGFVGDDALGEVVSVNLSDTPATDEDLMHLVVLSSLERLVLNDTKITDDGLRYVSQCRALRELSLWDTAVTDQGLRHLSRLRELESLSLVGTQVSDAGLSEVASMPKLKRLMLNHTAVTDEGYLRLRAALPECEIYASVPAAVAHFKKRLEESRKTQ